MMFPGTSFPSLKSINIRLGVGLAISVELWATPSSVPKPVKIRITKRIIPKPPPVAGHIFFEFLKCWQNTGQPSIFKQIRIDWPANVRSCKLSLFASCYGAIWLLASHHASALQ
jgi:hypothetical protein